MAIHKNKYMRSTRKNLGWKSEWWMKSTFVIELAQAAILLCRKESLNFWALENKVQNKKSCSKIWVQSCANRSRRQLDSPIEEKQTDWATTQEDYMCRRKEKKEAKIVVAWRAYAYTWASLENADSHPSDAFEVKLRRETVIQALDAKKWSPESGKPSAKRRHATLNSIRERRWLLTEEC